ncbi:pseudouridylate synthase RPUSD2 isoform X2 [Pongo pygmaeus]|uniref:Pseudouridine synthase n=1 Tax=Pongo abelii TaxID=9601 RepID=A0A2J8T360_PONAB|nr:pseudouridylate synthase RPUSD2 isoform X2 [Pongo abelii]XP_054306244.1 pseudouridylate synthase RPUSD2 isoform X2 [Pongo pygmaeus]PNJ27461.1 RPUSD2 isoform 3 [Pongo abelii]
MWLGGRAWLRVLGHRRCDLRRPSFTRTWSGYKGPMAETLSTQVGTAGGLRAPHQQNGDAGGDARVEPSLGPPKPAGREVEPAPVGEEHPSAAAPGPGKHKKRRGATRERVVPPPKKRRTGDNDFLRNTVHRHEPPVTAEPIRLLAENEDVVVVDKPSSIPVHPCGRFRHNTVIFILGKEHQLKELHPLHRLDRLTSGVLMFAKTAAVSERIHEQVRDRQLEKEYVCRVEGEFPTEEVTCKEPILVVSYKVGVCRVDPRGKPCETVFQRLSYNGQSSVVRCRPLTGRTHQIRVHLQFLGHPILNDPIYNSVAWGPSRGRGGYIPKTNEELLRDLVAEHQAKQSLDVLDLCEGDLSPGLTDPTAPSSELGKDNLEELAAAAQKMEEVAEAAPQELDTIALAPEKAVETDVMNQETDPLCAECRLVRQDPLPQDLVMFLHALRYKGPGFEYFSPMPAWAQDDWQKD